MEFNRLSSISLVKHLQERCTLPWRSKGSGLFYLCDTILAQAQLEKGVVIGKTNWEVLADWFASDPSSCSVAHFRNEIDSIGIRALAYGTFTCCVRRADFYGSWYDLLAKSVLHVLRKY
jgi:hypothetical protein